MRIIDIVRTLQRGERSGSGSLDTNTKCSCYDYIFIFKINPAPVKFFLARLLWWSPSFRFCSILTSCARDVSSYFSNNIAQKNNEIRLLQTESGEGLGCVLLFPSPKYWGKNTIISQETLSFQVISSFLMKCSGHILSRALFVTTETNFFCQSKFLSNTFTIESLLFTFIIK